MGDKVFEAALTRPARRVRSELNEQDRVEVDYLILLVERDPYADGIHKFWFRDGEECIYDNGVWRIGYGIVDTIVVEIRSISKIDPEIRRLQLRL